MPKRRISPRIIIISLLILAALAYAGYRGYSVYRKATNPTLTLYGNTDIRNVALSFRIFGRLNELHFDEGQKVKKGDLLAKLEATPYQEALTLAQAHLKAAGAVLSNAEKNYQRQSKLVETGAVSKTAFDDALGRRDEAAAQVSVAKSEVQSAQTQLEDASLYAPADGTLISRLREVGAVIQPGGPVFTLLLDGEVWVRAFVDEPNLGDVYPGQIATIKTDGGQTYQAVVSFISPQSEFTPKTVQTQELRTSLVYRLRLIVQNPDDKLRRGMPVTIELRKNKA